MNSPSMGQETSKISSVKPDVWIVLPGYNEEKHIASVLSRVKTYAKNIVFVDDGSTDDSYRIACNAKVHVLKHITNMGKGAALKTGCDYACEQGAQYIIVMDSDGQHDPSELKKFIRALEDGYDIVFGCRTWNKKMPPVMKLGNVFLYYTIKTLFGMSVEDTQSGYRAFTAEAYQKIRWESNDYSMESEMIVRAQKAGLRAKSVRIKTIYLDEYKGTTVFNGIKIALNVLFWRIFGTP